METNKTLATYIALGAVFIIVLGLLAVGLVWACRRWRCPYPCCCVWRCFQDPDQMREARAYLYTAPQGGSAALAFSYYAGGFEIYVPVLYQQLLLCYTVIYVSCAFWCLLLTSSKY